MVSVYGNLFIYVRLKKGVAFLSSHGLTLLASSGEVVPEVRRDLEACGIQLAVAEKGGRMPLVDGLLLTKSVDLDQWLKEVRVDKTPGLLLVYGGEVPYDLAETLDRTYAATGEWEVVRLMLLSGQERAWVGGSPNRKGVRSLCRQLAQHRILSMVCEIREVEEAIRQLPLYLAWKERFYIGLGDICDAKNISLHAVTLALGMDERIGQRWLYPQRIDHSPRVQWVVRECEFVMKKANVHRIVLWGPPAVWKQMPQGWLSDKEVCLYANMDEPFPNELFPGWIVCSSWSKALQNADLLVVGQTDDIIGQLPLPELVRLMRQAVVVDAAGCFPLQEARTYLKGYRAVGEKTNVWE